MNRRQFGFLHDMCTKTTIYSGIDPNTLMVFLQYDFFTIRYMKTIIYNTDAHMNAHTLYSPTIRSTSQTCSIHANPQ